MKFRKRTYLSTPLAFAAAGALGIAMTATSPVQAEDMHKADKKAHTHKHDNKQAKNNSEKEFWFTRSAGYIDMPVVDRDGRDVGSVSDLIINAKTGRIKHAIIAEGMMGTSYAVNYGQLSKTRMDGEATLQVNKSKQSIQAKGPFEPEKVKGLYVTGALQETGEALNLTEENDKGQYTLYRLSDLDGRTLVGPGEKELGTTDELLIECNSGHVAFLVVSPAASDIEGQRVVPYRTINSISGDQFVVNFDETKLARAGTIEKGTDLSDWKTQDDVRSFLKPFELEAQWKQVRASE